MAAVPMAVDTQETALLVDIRCQIMRLNPVGARYTILASLGGVGGAVFPAEIMLVSAVVIAAHIVAVVTAQALLVRGRTEGMALHFAILESQVTGAAPCAVGDGGIIVTLGKDMTAQASAAEHVVSQGKWSGDRGGNRDFPRGTQVVLCSEMAPDCVDFILKGEMQGMGGRHYLLGMAGAAGCCHSFRMAGLGDKTDMGFFDLAFIVYPFVAGNAGQLVGRIKLDSIMTPLAADFCRGRDRWLGCLRFLGLGRRSLLCPATA